MKVKAIRLGYYEHIRRRAGDVFSLTNSKHFSKNWMEEVDEKTEVKKIKADEKLNTEE